MPDLLENLNKEQLQAVTHTGGPLLIVAGAGTGKTTVITRRIAWLIEQDKARADEILALTFTDKAAGEMEERVDLLMPLGSFDMWISTFHGFCQRVLERHGLDIGLSNNFKLLDPVKQWMLIYNNFEKFKLDYYRPLGSPYKFIDALVSHFSRCKDEVIAPQDYLNYAEELRLSLDNPDFVKTTSGKPDFLEEDTITEIKRVEELASAFHTYQQLLLENEALDFGDLINYTLELFQKRPNTLKYYREKFKYILVDEFQDTNLAQYELVRMLSVNQKSESRKQKENGKSPDYTLHPTPYNLTVVGDDDQAIYKFRGASVSNILKFKEDFPDLSQITLTQNYRSSQEILDLAYNFIQHNNPDRLEVKLGISKRLVNPDIESRIKNQELRIKTEQNAGVLSRASSLLPLTSNIEVLEGKDLSEELDLVVKKVLEIKNKEYGIKNKELRIKNEEEPAAETSWNDFAILIRSNSAAEEILPRLDAAGIPYIYLSNTGLYKKTLIADIISYLKLLDNYHETSSLYRVLNFPKFRIAAEELSQITQFTVRKVESLFTALKDGELLQKLTAETREKIRELLRLLDEHTREAKDKSAVEMIVLAIKDLGLLQDLADETLENAQNREFMEQFYKVVEQHSQENSDKSLRSFLHYLDLEQKAGNEGKIKFDPNVGPEALKVMTIHSAKGLEFENVFIVNLVDQRFPTRARHDAIEIPERLIKDILPEGDFHLQEERRLFYVAMTRAKSRMYFSWARDYGGSRAKKPSVFLTEAGLIPSEKVNKATGKVVFERPPRVLDKQVYKDLPSKFSYSDINSFLQCPLEYKYRSYLKLPLPGNAYFSFGRSIHSALEKYLSQYQKLLNQPPEDLFGKTEIKLPTFDVLERYYNENWVDEWFVSKSQKEEYRRKGLELLSTFYEETLKTVPQPKYLEKFFKLKIGEFEFVGKIDRADIAENGLNIIDYKTGKPPKNKSDEDLDQLRVYQWAAQDFLKEKVSSLAYWYLEGNKLKEVGLATGNELASLQERLLETINQIREAVKFDAFSELHKQSKQHNCGFVGWG